MVTLACIGLFFIILSGIVNALELRKFFKALAHLNLRTKTLWDKLVYPVRFITLLPLLAPLIPDIILMSVGGTVGLGGGVLGFIIGLGGTCAITLIIKASLKTAKRIARRERQDWIDCRTQA